MTLKQTPIGIFSFYKQARPPPTKQKNQTNLDPTHLLCLCCSFVSLTHVTVCDSETTFDNVNFYFVSITDTFVTKFCGPFSDSKQCYSY